MDESDATSADFQAPKKENRWCLLELPKEQIEALEAGQLFHIKAHGSSAALSTESQTWAMEFLENSNPMYMGSIGEEAYAEGCKTEEATAEEENKDPNFVVEGTAAKEMPKTSKRCTIFAQCRGHILLKPLSCDTQRVRDLLAPHSIEETQGATASHSEPMTTSLLQYQVASSPKELQTMLEQGPYVERDGVWQWMPAAFEREVTDIVLNLVSLHSWDVKEVPVEELFRMVKQHFGEDGGRYVPSKAVLLNALRGIIVDAGSEEASGEKPSGEIAGAGPAAEGKIAFDAEKIKLFQATQLLRETPSRLRERFDLPLPASRPKRPRLTSATVAGGGGQAGLQIEDFCAAFSALMGSETTIEELCKIVGDRMYIDEMDGAVHSLDITTLPQEPRERLKRLFELSSHWKPDRLSSLMLPSVKGVKIDAWLLKWTKTVYHEFEKGKEIKLLTAKFAIS